MKSTCYLIVLLGFALAAFGEASPRAELPRAELPRAELPRASDPFARHPDILPVEDAFRIDTLSEGEDLEVRWQMPEGYYLYRHGFEVRSEQAGTIDYDLRAGVRRVDEYFGEVEVYFDEVAITIPGAASQTLSVRFQGCAEAGYCYPPRVVSVNDGKVQSRR